MVQNRRKVNFSFTFWEIWPFFGSFFKVNFSENWVSNEAQTKLKTRFKANLKNCPKSAKSQDIRRGLTKCF